MTSPTAARPAWVVRTLVVAIFAVAVFAVRAFGQVRGQPPFPTQPVPLPTASAATEAPARVDYGLTLTATGVGPHQFGTAGNAVLESLIQTLGPPTEDAPEECDSGQEPRLVRWADLSIRIESGQLWRSSKASTTRPGRRRSPSRRRRDLRRAIRRPDCSNCTSRRLSGRFQDRRRRSRRSCSSRSRPPGPNHSSLSSRGRQTPALSSPSRPGASVSDPPYTR
jgi:hypothetical protein